MPFFQTVVENLSRYRREVVWENAQDLEHVAYLHSQTNSEFKLMHHEKSPGSKFAYDLMVYRSVRKVYFLKINTFGFRKIIGEYNIHQVETIPLLGVTSALNSLLIENQDKEFPTLMRDEVVMEVPWYLGFMRSRLAAALKRHSRIQCQEDEPFRERRTELAKRGVNLPFRIFNRTQFADLTSRFKEKLPG